MSDDQSFKPESTDLIKKPRKYNRLASIDILRGIFISAMIFVNLIGEFSTTPSWSLHAPDHGLTYVDLVAPGFVFTIGLSYLPSFKNQIAKLTRVKLYSAIVRRYCAFIGMGMLGTLQITENGLIFDWGVLQSIGIAGLVAMFFIEIPRLYRFVPITLILITYHLIQSIPITFGNFTGTVSDFIFQENHGGLIGSFGYSIILLLAIQVSDHIFSNQIRWISLYGVLSLILGLCLGFIIPISKHRVSISFIFISFGISCCLFYIIWFLIDHKKLIPQKNAFFEPIGRNALFLYILHNIYYLILLLIPSNIPWLITIMIGLFSIGLTWLIARILDQKQIYITI